MISILSRGVLSVEVMYPLWAGCTAVDAFVVLVGLGDLEQLAPSLRVDFPHLAHLGGIVPGIFWRGWKEVSRVR